jgi:hypothetical protein
MGRTGCAYFMAVEGAGDETGEMNIGELFLSVNLVDVMGNLEGLANTL